MLRPPELPSYQALLSLWPSWLSYAVSYLFIAIAWAHLLLRYATAATPRLMWFNFALVGLGTCVCCLVFYLRPEAPGAESRLSRSPSRIAGTSP